MGIALAVYPGDEVEVGQPLLTIHHRAGQSLDEAHQIAWEAIEVGDDALEVPPLLHGTVGR